MRTLFSILFLVLFGVIANFSAVFLLNIAGLPGAILAGMPGKRSKKRFIFGAITSTIGQSYVYLAYVAFIVSWTILKARQDDIVGPLLWPFAFSSVFFPIWINLTQANAENMEQKTASAQVEALYLTVIAAVAGFFIFVFVPSAMRLGWGWLPYIHK